MMEKWMAMISIPEGEVGLGIFDSEEEAGIMYARACHKYPVPMLTPLDSSLSPIEPTPTTSSHFPSEWPV